MEVTETVRRDEMTPTLRRQSTLAALLLLYRQLSASRRRMFHLTLVLLVVGGLAELATIGAVFPFLVIITPGAEQGPAAPVVAWVRALSDSIGLSAVLTAVVLLALIAVVSTALRMLLTRISFDFVFGAAHDLDVQLYDRMLRQDYAYHVMRNSSHVLAGLEKVQHVVAYILVPAMMALTSLGVALFSLTALLLLDPYVVVVSIMLFGSFYGVVTLATRRRLLGNSEAIAAVIRRRVQLVQEGLGGIRDVLLDRSQPIFVDKFERMERSFRNAQAVNYFISSAPRFVIEGGIIIAIGVIALYMSGRPGGLHGALPLLGAIAVGAQRLLPLVQQIYASCSQVFGSRGTLLDVLELVTSPVEEVPASVPPLPFARTIEFRKVTFTYPSADEPALRHINLTIAKGERIGFIGKSGSGKSTLVDLLMGLLDPIAGHIVVDGVTLDGGNKAAWQRRVAHVPQAIFLSDNSIAANIAFGRRGLDIDMQHVRRAAERANLADFVESLPQGYETETGERGVRLSGGQRQRIGIARALYKGADVLILDEATSALDDATEAAVIDSIAGLSDEVTVVMVAHRLSTLRGCDRIVEIEGGQLARIASYEEIIGASGRVQITHASPVGRARPQGPPN